MFPFIEIFGRQIGTYSLFAFLGLFVCGLVITVSCKKVDINIEDTVILVLITSAGLLVDGHILFGITNFKSILDIFNNTYSFKQILNILVNSFGGMVFYGGFIGGAIALWVYKTISSAEFKEYIFDIYAFSIPLFHFFGRIGCFFAGCCYGIESKFGFTVYDNPVIPDINNVKRFPVSLVESALNLLIFAVLFFMFKKEKCKSKLKFVYMLSYSIVRFCVEFLRGDIIRGVYFGISTSQWISIILFAFSVTKLFIIKNKSQ
ncbi:MAG: prolipoprotein diacylglyceryl transferase family protein [Acutalibacteraceae bacterium]|nr:prolipoprotein diacylglyceryl transferase family protein [Acutalibacteraceae bacterium]